MCKVNAASVISQLCLHFSFTNDSSATSYSSLSTFCCCFFAATSCMHVRVLTFICIRTWDTRWKRCQSSAFVTWYWIYKWNVRMCFKQIISSWRSWLPCVLRCWSLPVSYSKFLCKIHQYRYTSMITSKMLLYSLGVGALAQAIKTENFLHVHVMLHNK